MLRTRVVVREGGDLVRAEARKVVVGSEEFGEFDEVVVVKDDVEEKVQMASLVMEQLEAARTTAEDTAVIAYGGDTRLLEGALVAMRWLEEKEEGNKKKTSRVSCVQLKGDQVCDLAAPEGSLEKAWAARATHAHFVMSWQLDSGGKVILAYLDDGAESSALTSRRASRRSLFALTAFFTSGAVTAQQCALTRLLETSIRSDAVVVATVSGSAAASSSSSIPPLQQRQRQQHKRTVVAALKFVMAAANAPTPLRKKKTTKTKKKQFSWSSAGSRRFSTASTLSSFAEVDNEDQDLYDDDDDEHQHHPQEEEEEEEPNSEDPGLSRSLAPRISSTALTISELRDELVARTRDNESLLEALEASTAAADAAVADRDREAYRGDALALLVDDLRDELETYDRRPVHARKLSRSRRSLVSAGFDFAVNDADDDAAGGPNSRRRSTRLFTIPEQQQPLFSSSWWDDDNKENATRPPLGDWNSSLNSVYDRVHDLIPSFH
eukprot:CAMPEP_0118907144 /NCGR_PEP_ID=MMETSP1166-20130328/10730_1 /TAXON_ID=1104430 /ORGANISM="Chrysoreinhardia sp, Strain CCMP3193" /LENGTH=493 /DNA_ID=CAMNT_0006846505 /DNA_START=21 /DNA_END=1502 /DNA_ORIENTATION=+